MPRAARKWTQEEDDLLSREVNVQVAEGIKRDWTIIANKISGRTNKDCRKRWHNALSGVFNKGYWTEEEDRLLTRAVQTHGEIWTAAAEIVTMRSADQCAKRWKQFLDPQLNRCEWSEEENRLLVEVAVVKGRRWKEIQIEHLPFRSLNSIKNQYTILTRRESRLRDGKTRKIGENQDKPTARKTARPTDMWRNNGDDRMGMDEESSDEEDEISGEEDDFSGEEDEVSGEEAIKSSTSISNFNPLSETPEKASMDTGPDTLVWGNFPAEVSGPAWNPTVEDTEFNGTLPDLPAFSSDFLQGIDSNASHTTNHGLYSNLLELTPTDMAGYLTPDDTEIVGFESHQPINMPLQGTAMWNSQGNRIILSIEEADNRTLNSLLQVAFSSGSRFHLTRE